MAICLNPEFDYVLVKAGGEIYIVAKELAESVMKAARHRRTTRSWPPCKGSEFELHDRLAPPHGPGFSGHSAATTSRWTPAPAASTPPLASALDDFYVCQQL